MKKLPEIKSAHDITGNSNYVIYIGVLALLVYFGFFIGEYTRASVIFLVSIGIFLILYKRPLEVLFILLIISPFAQTLYFKDRVFGIPGLKPIVLVGVLVIFVSLINFQKFSKMPRYASLFSLAILMIFTIAIIRSIRHLSLFNQLEWSEDNLSVIRYLLSAYIKQLIFFIPFLIIAKYANTKIHITKIMNIIFLTILILSFHIIYIYFHYARSYTLSGGISEIYNPIYNMHRNNVALFFACGLPFALNRYFKSYRFIDFLYVVIILFAIAILFSRTGYGAAIIAMTLFVIYYKKIKIIPFIILGTVCMYLILPNTVLNRASWGIKDRNIEKISAGRVEAIWVPLLEETLGEKTKLLFGNGRYAILATDSLKKGEAMFTIDPHNMYLELLLDSGVVGLMIILTFYGVIIRIVLRSMKRTNNIDLKGDIFACLVAILCFLAAGMTGNSFFPSNANILMWAVLGCAVTLCKMVEKEYQK